MLMEKEWWFKASCNRQQKTYEFADSFLVDEGFYVLFSGDVTSQSWE